MSNELAVVVLAAGLGTRMRSQRPKVLHEVGGRPLIGHVLGTIAGLGASRVVVVVGPGMDAVVGAAQEAAPGIAVTSAVQTERLGTGHAVLAAREALRGFEGTVLIAYGDTPLIRTETLRRLAEASAGRAVVVTGMRPADPGAYGRLVTGPGGALERIVEAKDASESERAITLCNGGVMAIDGRRLFAFLSQLRPENAKGEYYLTDVIGLARAAGLQCGYIEVEADELMGVNARAELAVAESLFQARRRTDALAGGATLLDPSSVWFSHDTMLGRDVVIGPCVMFGPGVRVEDEAVIRGFCHIEGATIAQGAVIGPFARLRPGAAIGPEAHVGNFVEIKAAVVEAGAKINHLSYVGDAFVGAKANVGAGTITCNYDGFVKARTEIGAGAFIGSNTALVAPVKVGAGAIVAAGSVITHDVGADAMAVARGRQVEKAGWAKAFRAERAQAKLKSKRSV